MRKQAKYKKAKYYRRGNDNNDNEVFETAYIYSALGHFFDFEKCVIVGTAGSAWCDLYYHLFEGNIPDEEYWHELQEMYDDSPHYNKDIVFVREKLEKLKQAMGDKCAEIIVLKYGLDSGELLFNFKTLSTVSKYIKDGDSLSFDITHSFRSLAFYELLSVLFFKDVAKRNVKIDFVSYGMLEASGELDEKTPIVDMKPLIDVLEWIKAAEEYRNFGTAYNLYKLLETDSLGLSEEGKEALGWLGEVISGNDISKFKNLVKNCVEIVRGVDSDIAEEHMIVGWIFRDIADRFADTLENDYLLRFELTKWHFEKKRGHIAAITLSETLLDIFAEYADINRDCDNDKCDNKLRQRIASARSSNSMVKELLNKYSENARRLRNSVCHGKPLVGEKGKKLNELCMYFPKVYEEHFKDNEQNQADLREALNQSRAAKRKKPNVNTLRLTKYNFTLRFTADAELPPFVGNTVRGALGSALDKMGSAAYENVFKIEATESMPNPHTISVRYPSASKYKKDDTLPFSVTLFGVACEYGEDIVAAAKQMCRGKLKDCVVADCGLEFDRVWSDAGAENIPPSDSIKINFVTPTEMLSSKEAISELTFETFIDRLFGRISDIIDNYTDGEFVVPYALTYKKPNVSVEYNLEPTRFKTSGQPINGLIGSVRYSGNITRYLPYIDLGSQLHIGKKTTRACGEYIFEI
jgi:CRISPR-associated Csx2 family protein